MLLDIRGTVKVNEGERFFVDTNVWYWMTYISSKEFVANQPHDYQLEFYPAFVEKVLEEHASLYYSPLVLVELANLIERSEHAIYEQYHGRMSLKRFRNIEAERKCVVQEIKSAWDTVKTMAKPLVLRISDDFSECLMDAVENYCLDGYDAVYYELMKENEIANIITDDKDFRAIPDVRLFSCYHKA